MTECFRKPIAACLPAAFAAWALLVPPAVLAQQPAPPPDPAVERVESLAETLRHRLDVLDKSVDDDLWFERVSAVAVVEKLPLLVFVHGGAEKLG
jgi:hypothetical protein